MRKTLILGLLALFIIIPISDALAYGTDYRYTGQQRDANSNLYYYGQRYYDPHTGKFTQTDPVVKFLHDPEILNKATNERLQEILANPQKFNEYSYTTNNPVIYTDPLGLDSALIIYGGNKREGEGDSFKNLADQSAVRLKEGDKNNKYDDGIFVVDGSSFEKWQEALKNYKDISHIEYWGHGYDKGLTISGGSTEGYLITQYESNVGKKDHYINELYIGNTTPDLEIDLNTCHSATAPLLGFGKSIGQVFANNFNATVKAFAGKTNYENGLPVVRWYGRDFIHLIGLLWRNPVKLIKPENI